MEGPYVRRTCRVCVRARKLKSVGYDYKEDGRYRATSQKRYGVLPACAWPDPFSCSG